MQRVEHKYKNMHKVFDDIESYYTLMSDTTQNNSLILPTFDLSFSKLNDIFANNGIVQVEIPQLVDKHYGTLDCKSADKTIIICYSGGKDSIATVLKYKEQGYKIYLYHCKNVNPSLSDETASAIESAKLLDVPIYIDEIRFKGHHCYMEHPMKNMLIMNGCLHYALSHNLGTHIATGNYTESYLEDNPFERCAGDCVDMWNAYTNIIKPIIPSFQLDIALENMGETLDIVTAHRELLDVSHSCLCRHSLRPYRHNWVKTKFGIELPKIRCGSCYKCCVEYIYMADHNLIEFSREYYRYCLNQLYKVHTDEVGYVENINRLWNYYFFYPIENSKIYDEMGLIKFFKRNMIYGKNR